MVVDRGVESQGQMLNASLEEKKVASLGTPIHKKRVVVPP